MVRPPGAITYTPVSPSHGQNRGRGGFPGHLDKQLLEPRVSSSWANVGRKSSLEPGRASQNASQRGTPGDVGRESPGSFFVPTYRWPETCVTEHLRMSKADP